MRLIYQLKELYKPSEPILLDEVFLLCKDKKKDTVRKELERLVFTGDLIKRGTGVFGLPGKDLDLENIIKKKYITDGNKVYGFYTGMTLLNYLNLCSQKTFVKQIITNKTSCRYRKVKVGYLPAVVKKAKIKITNSNIMTLEFLEMLKYLDDYCDLDDEKLLEKFILDHYMYMVDKKLFDKYLPRYPKKVKETYKQMGLYALPLFKQ